MGVVDELFWDHLAIHQIKVANGAAADGYYSPCTCNAQRVVIRTRSSERAHRFSLRFQVGACLHITQKYSMSDDAEYSLSLRLCVSWFHEAQSLLVFSWHPSAAHRDSIR